MSQTQTQLIMAAVAVVLEERGWNWADLAVATDIAQPRFSKLRKGTGNIYAHELLAIGDALRVSLDRFRPGGWIAPEAEPTTEQSIILRLIFDGPRALGFDEALRRLAAAPIASAAREETPRESSSHRYIGSITQRGDEPPAQQLPRPKRPSDRRKKHG